MGTGLNAWGDSPTEPAAGGYAPTLPSRDMPHDPAIQEDTQHWRGKAGGGGRRGSPGRARRGGGHSPMRNREERPCCLYLHFNGEIVEPRQGTKLIVKLSALKDFDELTDEITAKLGLPRRAKKLFHADGAAIASLSEIAESGGSLDVVVSSTNVFLPPTQRSRHATAKWNSANSPARASSAGRSRRDGTKSPTRRARRSPARRASPGRSTSRRSSPGRSTSAASAADSEPSMAEKRRMVLQAKQARAAAARLGLQEHLDSVRAPRSPETLEAREATRGVRDEQARQAELDARVKRMEQQLAAEKSKQKALQKQLVADARARVNEVQVAASAASEVAMSSVEAEEAALAREEAEIARLESQLVAEQAAVAQERAFSPLRSRAAAKLPPLPEFTAPAPAPSPTLSARRELSYNERSGGATGSSIPVPKSTIKRYSGRSRAKDRTGDGGDSTTATARRHGRERGMTEYGADAAMRSAAGAEYSKHRRAHDSRLIVPSKAERMKMFKRMDYNGNGMLSLAEIDKAVLELFPEFDNKPALMRAYKAADHNGDGFITRREFRLLLQFLVYFTDVWHLFEQIDTDHDRRMSRGEFAQGCTLLGIELSEEEADDEFEILDENGGGVVLFDEFCKWIAHRHEAAMRLGGGGGSGGGGGGGQSPRRQQVKRLPEPASGQGAAAASAAAVEVSAEERMRAEFEAEVNAQRQQQQEQAVAAVPAQPQSSAAPQKKPRELYYAVSMDRAHTRATVAEFAARCLSGEVSRHAVMVWSSGMDNWSLPDEPMARQAIPELDQLLPAV